MAKIKAHPGMTVSPKGAFTQVRIGDAGETAVQVEAWGLEPPTSEYFADACAVRVVDGTPTIFFAQRGADDDFVNAIALAMTTKSIRDLVLSFDQVIARMTPEEQAAGHALENVQIRSIPPENFRKFPATIVRGGSGSEGAMIDFYRVALGVAQQMARGIPDDLVVPCVRVFMAPSTMVHLLDIIRSQGLAPS
jgi:hypothetical protein